MGNHILRSHCIKEVDFESQLAQVKSKFKAKKEALVKKSKKSLKYAQLLFDRSVKSNQKENLQYEYSEKCSRNNCNLRENQRINKSSNSANRNNDGCLFDSVKDYSLKARAQRRHKTPDSGATPRFGSSESNSGVGFKNYRKNPKINPVINTICSDNTDDSLKVLEDEFNEIFDHIAESNTDEGYNSILCMLENHKI